MGTYRCARCSTFRTHGNFAGQDTSLREGVGREMNLRTNLSRSPHEPHPQFRLAVPEIDTTPGSLLWLAQRFHLDVHGSSGLFHITQIEMGFAALLLTAV